MSDSSDLSLLAGQAVALAEAFRDGRRSPRAVIRAAGDMAITLTTFPGAPTLLRWSVRELLVGMMSSATAYSDHGKGLDYLIASVRMNQAQHAERSRIHAILDDPSEGSTADVVAAAQELNT